VLADAAARVPGFKPSKSEIDQMLKKVAGNPTAGDWHECSMHAHLKVC
jgi:hypothetical protein